MSLESQSLNKPKLEAGRYRLDGLELNLVLSDDGTCLIEKTDLGVIYYRNEGGGIWQTRYGETGEWVECAGIEKIKS